MNLSIYLQMHKTFLQLLRECDCLKIDYQHLLSYDEKEKIAEHFRMKEMQEIDLKNLRDMTVMYYTALIQNDLNVKKNIQIMSAITSIIDLYLIPKTLGT